jgi:hypothetical protein
VQRPAIDPALHRVLAEPATVGALLDLCEENYQLLRTIAPYLRSLQGCQRAGAALMGPDLHLEILAQSRYTTTLRLTYYFDELAGRSADPDATLRVYHDARQVEVLDLRQRALPTARAFTPPGLDRKWKANLFVSKWLWFCVVGGYRFGAGAAAQSLRPERAKPTPLHGLTAGLQTGRNFQD